MGLCTVDCFNDYPILQPFGKMYFILDFKINISFDFEHFYFLRLRKTILYSKDEKQTCSLVPLLFFTDVIKIPSILYFF